MSKHHVIRRMILASPGLCIVAATFAADIYRSGQADGTDRYASAPLDASYSLYLKGETETIRSAQIPSSSSGGEGKVIALEPLIQQFAQRHAVEPALVQAIIDVESQFNSKAVSGKGATGVMQLMPATAARYGVTNRADPVQNIESGVRYLKDLLILHHGNIPLVLASYNAGEGTVARNGRRIPPYKETMLYVPAVLARLHAARNVNFR